MNISVGLSGAERHRVNVGGPVHIRLTACINHRPETIGGIAETPTQICPVENNLYHSSCLRR